MHVRINDTFEYKLIYPSGRSYLADEAPPCSLAASGNFPTIPRPYYRDPFPRAITSMGKSPAIHIPSGARTADARENVKSRDIYISLISRIFTNLQAEPTTSSASAGEKFGHPKVCIVRRRG